MPAILGLAQWMDAVRQSIAAWQGACDTRAVPPPLPASGHPTSMHLGEAFEGLSAGFHLFLLKTVGYMQMLTSDSPGQPLLLTPKHPFFCAEVESFPHSVVLKFSITSLGGLSGLSNWCLQALSPRSALTPQGSLTS